MSSPDSQLLDPLGMTLDQFCNAAAGLGRGPHQALHAYRRVFRHNLPASTGGRVWARANPGPIVHTLEEQTPEGPTVKFLQQVGGVTAGALSTRPGFQALTVESVLIPMIGRLGKRSYTLCLSSQVGCAMGCTFCETAQMGLIRSLTPAEIVGQWFAATHLLDHAEARDIRNLVFMGMGEPMDNLDNVLQAIRVLCDANGPALGASNITISTVGRIDGIARLSAFARQPGFHRLGLAISINAPNDQIRSQIMPINRSSSMGDLRDALLAYPMRSGGKFCFEYVLIPGVNDAPEHARQLADYLAPFGKWTKDTLPLGVLNLIPYNPRHNSPWPAPTEESVEFFLTQLVELGVYAKRRRTKGRQMMGACGQLGARHIRSRRVVEPTSGGAPIL
ncbi:MAG: 23S rRNA (adenine(2503)-C(2))-methyltransferase RlmN [Leptolyngbya sp. PLA3]|nr:MAG: 23S rRNA (adenine(2503)-C(2))-methyltransferase RlmN [Cyanobacteria bacterium CYA]MCE7967785.1 23S rRNA (adenine(2503)-C(2))-methyltransferase RlmN [Leptolyngbya sp. PL-A3]